MSTSDTVIGKVYSEGSYRDLLLRYNSTTNCDMYGYRVGNNFRFHRIGEPALYHHIKNWITWDVHGIEHYRTQDYCEACGFDKETTLYWVLKYGDTLPSSVEHI